MAATAARALKNSVSCFTGYTPALAESIRRDENECDKYEDILGSYLVKVSSTKMGSAESEEATAILKSIGDFERISDHAVNILGSAEELRDKHLTLTEPALREYDVISSAVCETLDLAVRAFSENDTAVAVKVEPLEQVIDSLKEQLRTRHIIRMQEGLCSIEVGFVWSDMLTNLERVSDHCSNIAGCVIDTAQHNLNTHELLRATKKDNSDYDRRYAEYAEKYAIAE